MEPAQQQQSEFDYIVVGAGTAGSALASRLAQNLPKASIAVLEAGPDITSHPLPKEPLAVFGAHFSELDYAYRSVPQPQLAGRQIYSPAGKGLGGSSAINYGGWTRGSKLNYDLWAEAVGDETWKWENMLPYFKKAETYQGPASDIHGTNGPMHIASISASDPDRRYPLRDTVRAAYEQTGLKFTGDDPENPIGFAEVMENWYNGERQISANAYNLRDQNVSILTTSPVQKIIIDPATKQATGIELTTGHQLTARKEVIISSGSYRTPQVLMLSGIGPKPELDKHNIPIIEENPAVGANLHNHPALYTPFKLRDPSRGLAVGSEKFMSNPAFFKGFPYDWLISGHSKEAVTHLDPSDSKTEILSNPKYPHYESFHIYAPPGPPFDNTHLGPIPDGSIIGSLFLAFAPTSRGTVTLPSTSALDHPLIDPRHLSTEYDKIIMRTALREQLNILLGTPQFSELIEKEVTPPGCKELTLESTDADLDERIVTRMQEFFHPAGTAAMGTVVDTEFRVKGVKGLRVCDASVMPIPLSAHPQACTYAMAERAAERIAADAK